MYVHIGASACFRISRNNEKTIAKMCCKKEGKWGKRGADGHIVLTICICRDLPWKYRGAL